MPRKEKPTAEAFLEILKNNGHTYTVTSMKSEPIDINFPNLPDWHKDEFDEWRHGILPDSKVIRFEYQGFNYKLKLNNGDPDCNDGMFGALYDENNEIIGNLKSTGDMETTIESVKDGDKVIENDHRAKLKLYLAYFEIVLAKETELEYLIFKVLFENGCLYDLSGLEDRYQDYSDEDSDEDSDKDSGSED